MAGVPPRSRSESLATLSEKEQEALWLLLSGYDAKSSATELDLSVHTVNDRLRAARRKLGVSSSREAARLLAESSAQVPEHLAPLILIPKSAVHKGLRVAGQSEPDDDEPNGPDAEESSSHRRRFRNGVIIMSTLLVAAVLGIAYASGGSISPEAGSTAAAQSTTSTRSAASQSRALEWLALLDAVEVEASLNQAGEALRERHSEPLWELGVKLRQNNYGAVLNRELSEVRSLDARADIGKGAFQVLVFRTDFLRARDAIEEVVMQREEGEWRVIDYDVIRPDQR